MSGPSPELGDTQLQIGTYRVRHPANLSAVPATPAITTIGRIWLVQADIDSPGPLTPVRFIDSYWPNARDGWPVRGGEYRGGDVASFPQQEAQKLIAAGLAVTP